ncbi:lysozyme inhibitor LprI family protein [Mycobacterium sp. Lab-001]|uniref:lysozyme inhibitor LprI family protein n=1 Tax=Mycobacterium sp. Lab-001 TaxID=3410136 RepID=UPI003D18512B
MRLMPTTVAALVLSVCGVAAAHPAAGTSAGADCAAPVTAVKQLICTDPHLSDLNHRTKTAYHQALARRGADRAALLSARKNWKVARDGCAYNTDVHNCVLAAYQPAGFGQLTSQFYGQLASPIAVLNWKGDHQVLLLRRSGYPGSENAEHRGKVKLEFNGTTFLCRPE